MTDMAPADGGQGAASVAPVSPENTGAITQLNNGSPGQLSNGFEWLNGADELTVGYAQNKGWDNPMKVLDSYKNLEKLFGADKAGRTVVMPKEGEDYGAFYDKLGRPSDANGYKVQTGEGSDPAATQALLGKFHELGLSKSQGEALANWFNESIQTGKQAEENNRAMQFDKEENALRTEWGAAYTQNVAAAQNAARGLGMDAETIDKISGAIGHQATMSLLAKIGGSMSEDKFVTGANQPGFNSVMTPAQAKAEIQSLMGDRDFVAKYTGGAKDAREKMAQLHAYAFPEG